MDKQPNNQALKFTSIDSDKTPPQNTQNPAQNRVGGHDYT